MPHPLIFDRRLLRARRVRAAVRDPATFLVERAADDLAGRLSAVLRKFDLAVDLGTPTDALRRALADRVGAIVAVDPVASRLAGERLAANYLEVKHRQEYRFRCGFWLWWRRIFWRLCFRPGLRFLDCLLASFL